MDIQELIEARIAEQVREQVADILADLDQRRESERWNRIFHSVLEDLHASRVVPTTSCRVDGGDESRAGDPIKGE